LYKLFFVSTKSKHPNHPKRKGKTGACISGRIENLLFPFEKVLISKCILKKYLLMFFLLNL